MSRGCVVRRLAGAVACTLLAGCPAAGIYRTARTLEPGEGDVAVTVSATRLSSEGSSDSLTVPSIIPELSYHVGVADDVEFGGRVGAASLLIEGDLKFRFIGSRTADFHAAFQPAFGYRSLITASGPAAALPVILTWDLGETQSFNLAALGSFMSLESNGGGGDLYDAVGTSYQSVGLGGGLGLEIRGETIHVMPGVEVQHHLALERGEDFTTVSFGMTVGFVVGRDSRRLERVEDKVDRIDERLDDVGEKLEKVDEKLDRALENPRSAPPPPGPPVPPPPAGSGGSPDAPPGPTGTEVPADGEPPIPAGDAPPAAAPQGAADGEAAPDLAASPARRPVTPRDR